MKRITYAVLSTVTALVLLFGYRTSTSSELAGSTVIKAPIQGGSTGATRSAGLSANSAGSSPPSSSGSSRKRAASTSGSNNTSPAVVTITGAAADTPYGPVQVQVTVQSKKVTHVSVVEYPNGGGRDGEINAYALPILINETLSSQTAQIDMVSGATYTSQGYLTSLQSALDKAGL